jgi:hypothetical protein
VTADELSAFLAEVRADADEHLAILAAVDPFTLPPELRAEYDRAREAWEQLRAMTADDVVALYVDACLQAGRQLTPAETRALPRRQ